MKDFPFRAGDKVDVAVNLKENVYKGTRGITVLVKDIRPSGEDEDAFFGDRSIYEKFVSAGGLSAAQAEKILPTREDMAEVFLLSARVTADLDFLMKCFWYRLGFRPSFGK